MQPSDQQTRTHETRNTSSDEAIKVRFAAAAKVHEDSFATHAPIFAASFVAMNATGEQSSQLRRQALSSDESQ